MLRSGNQIGPYTLIHKLGRGQFGIVWLSERRTSIATTFAALKIPLDDDVDLKTIKQEANVWVRASGHPNVLPIIEANIYDEQVVIASEYAPDGSLESWLEQYGGKAPSVKSAVEIACGILAGLETFTCQNYYSSRREAGEHPLSRNHAPTHGFRYFSSLGINDANQHVGRHACVHGTGSV